MNKNMNLNKNITCMVEIPETVLAGLFGSVNELANMHYELIQLYEVESQLKKQHKAYLHVRDHAEAVCAADKQKVLSIMEKLVDLMEDHDKSEKKSAPENKKLDVFNLPEGMVVMSTDTLGIMQDDMLLLAEEVDHMVGVFRSLLSGRTIDGKSMDQMLRVASNTVEDVFTRWDDADLTELA
jgi:hypothetical protein